MAKPPPAGRGAGRSARPPLRASGGGKAATAGPVRGAAREIDPPKPRVSPAQFGREVRAEARKITWPSRRETWVTSVMVFIMVVLAAVFFALIDGTLSFLLGRALQWVS